MTRRAWFLALFPVAQAKPRKPSVFKSKRMPLDPHVIKRYVDAWNVWIGLLQHGQIANREWRRVEEEWIDMTGGQCGE